MIKNLTQINLISYRFLWLMMALWGIPYQLFGQDSKYFINIDKSDGLSSNAITAITQDQEGFIWIGTKSGVNRYDGLEFTKYLGDKTSLNSIDVTSLHVGMDGKIYAGYLKGGVAVYDADLDDFRAIESINKDLTVNSFLQKDSANIWVLTDQGLFNLIDGNKIFPDNSNKEAFMSICNWNDSHWLGTYYGDILEVRQNQLQNTYETDSNKKSAVNRVWSLLPISATELLIGTHNKGLLKFDHTTGQYENTEIKAEIVRSLSRDHNGHIWVGTDGYGIYEMEPNGKINNYQQIFGNEKSIASNAIICVFEDNQNNIWIGTAWNGISVISKSNYDQKFYYSDFTGEKNAGVLCILKEDYRIWLGSDGDGIHTYPSLEKDWKELRDYLGENTYPQFIKKINNNRFCIGTFKKGLFILDPSKRQIRQFKHMINDSSTISHNDVRDMEYIGNEEYLIASWGGGLNVFNIKSGTFYRPESVKNSILKNAVTLERINNNEILVGTFEEGLFRYRIKDQSLIKIQNIKPESCISILKSKNAIWIGTWTDGLIKSNIALDSFTNVSNEYLNKKTAVLSILPGADHGVVICSKDKIYHVDQNLKTTELEGISGENHINSSFYEQNGSYYFGNTDGAVSLQVNQFAQKSANPVKLTSVKLFDEKITYPYENDEPLELSHDQNVLTFDFASLVYPTSSEITYEIKVNPIHKNWISLGKNRSITLANLDPDEYELMMRTTLSPKVSNLHFVIHRPWYKTWWAFVIYMIVFIFMLYLFRYYVVRFEKLKGRLSLEQLNHEKDTELANLKQKFFINISHEIRTPLTLIIGEIERISAKSGPFKSLQTSISNILQNGNYIMQLVNELLDYGKLESKKLKLFVGEGNIVSFSKEIFLAFQNLGETKSIAYNFEAERDEIKLWYDRDQMEKVIYNLLSNAFKYTPEGGQIDLVIEENEEEVLLNFKDNGKGIPNAQIDNIFKRFYQSDNAELVNETGFGIGLSIVEEVVKLHSGQISVESEINKGSIFTVRLPKGKKHFKNEQLIQDFLDSESIQHYHSKTDEEALNESTINSEKKDDCILVIEDNDSIRDFIVQELQSDFKVSSASNGAIGLEIINSEIPDLIISDVMMPVMDGIELVRKVKQNIITCHIPVILLTARTGLIYKKEGFENGADAYITKPFNTSILRNKVHNIIETRRAFRERLRKDVLIKPKNLDLLPPDEKFLVNLTKIIDKNLDNSELDAKIISKELGMSHSVAYKKLKGLTGFTMVEFLRDYRLIQASKLLAEYGMSVAEASYKVGYSDKKHFSLLFKKKFGITPSTYAQNEKGTSV